MTKRSVRSADVAGQRVFVRVDFNLPMEDGRITDDTRIRAAIPTIALLREGGARIILASHLGRPNGGVTEDLRMEPIAVHLQALLDAPVLAATEITGESVQAVAGDLEESEILVLENLRFDPREEANDAEFAAELASLADLYVNDAFGAAHRAHASTEGIAHLLPAYAGLLMLAELDALGHLLDGSERPFFAILGGAKVSDKLGVIGNLLAKVDGLIVGGGMANTFLLAQGKEIGASLAEPDLAADAKALLDRAGERGIDILLPTDVVVADDSSSERGLSVSVDEVPASSRIFDIGPQTRADYARAISGAQTIFWNGPMGVFEHPPFAAGTTAVAQAVARAGGTSIVGGGDSVAALQALGLADRITHVSTGGGASLEFVEGKSLPGVAVIPDGE